MLEIEKKYRLSQTQRDWVRQRLAQLGAQNSTEEFEENTLYGSSMLELGRSILRLRRTETSATLTHKQRIPTSSAIKHQVEHETRIADPDAMAEILAALGFTPTLVYEKFRETWMLDDVEIVIDRLPFGLFMEIEGSEEAIDAMENKLGIREFEAEHSTYPRLTLEHGKRLGDLVTARFSRSRLED